MMLSFAKRLVIVATACFLYSSGEGWVTVAASKNVANNDASTGTITNLPPGVGKRPVSCDEMLAKAVVLAHEERAVATKEREDAIKASQRALYVAEKASDQLQEANFKVSSLSAQLNENIRNVTYATEELRQKSKQDMDALRESVDKQMSEAQSKADLAVREAKQNLDALRESAEKQLSETREKADLAVRKTLQQHDDAIRIVQEEAALNISECKRSYAEEIDALTKQIEQNAAAAELQIKKVKEDATHNLNTANESYNVAMAEVEKNASNRVHEAEERAKAEIATALSESQEAQATAKAEIEEAQIQARESSKRAAQDKAKKIAEANALVETARVESEQKIEAVTKAKEEKIAEANALVEIARVELQQKIEAVTKAKEEELLLMRNEADAKNQALRENTTAELQLMLQNSERISADSKSLQEQTQQNALDQVNAIKKTTSKEIGRIKREANEKMKEMEEAALQEIELAKENASALGEKMTILLQQIQKLDAERAILHKELSRISNNLADWESRKPQYCNITLMKVDSKRVFNNAVAVVTNETISALRVAQLYADYNYRVIADVAQKKKLELLEKRKDLIKTLLVAVDPRLKEIERKKVELLEKTTALMKTLYVAADPHLKKIDAWYAQNLKVIVDTHVTPLYRSRVLPFIVSCRNLLTLGLSIAVKHSRYRFKVAITYVRKLITILLVKVEKSEIAKKWLPSFMLSALKYAKGNTEQLIVWIFTSLAFLASFIVWDFPALAFLVTFIVWDSLTLALLVAFIFRRLFRKLKKSTSTSVKTAVKSNVKAEPTAPNGTGKVGKKQNSGNKNKK